MRFLRVRHGNVETAWQSSRYTASDRSHALHVLGDAVVLARHPYDRDPHSGAGNCWCGRAQSHSLHSVVGEPL